MWWDTLFYDTKILPPECMFCMCNWETKFLLLLPQKSKNVQQIWSSPHVEEKLFFPSLLFLRFKFMTFFLLLRSHCFWKWKHWVMKDCMLEGLRKVKSWAVKPSFYSFLLHVKPETTWKRVSHTWFWPLDSNQNKPNIIWRGTMKIND